MNTPDGQMEFGFPAIAGRQAVVTPVVATAVESASAPDRRQMEIMDCSGLSSVEELSQGDLHGLAPFRDGGDAHSFQFGWCDRMEEKGMLEYMSSHYEGRMYRLTKKGIDAVSKFQAAITKS